MKDFIEQVGMISGIENKLFITMRPMRLESFKWYNDYSKRQLPCMKRLIAILTTDNKIMDLEYAEAELLFFSIDLWTKIYSLKDTQWNNILCCLRWERYLMRKYWLDEYVYSPIQYIEPNDYIYFEDSEETRKVLIVFANDRDIEVLK